ncbi:MAG: FMN-binding negative transcriptional regulator [Calditrichaeota bacterium]|nr:MAG: FMN-binding negative transcriptional regulator [Calditrichota bacterium]
MYTPNKFVEKDEQRLLQLVDENSFGTLISVVDDLPVATHIPFLVEKTGALKLVAHLAKANPHWQFLKSNPEAMVIFHGPHSYISPTWYTENDAPTWNYAVVHFSGSASVFTDTARLRDIVEALATKHEKTNTNPWKPEYPAHELRGIVGIEIEVNQIEGKFKLNQNRPAVDQQNVIEKLCEIGSDNALGVAELMRENMLKKK